MTPAPFFSIITVARNDAWSLIKTARSMFEQEFRDFEYMIVDGASNDGSQSLVTFWTEQGLVTKAVSEPDTGVYNGMNKGLRIASGQFVCFLNASDVFSSPDVLRRVHEAITAKSLDGLLGWGELNDQFWTSWTEDEAFKMASLGFCHQSLFVRRALLIDEPFDERAFKTDSDTLQLGRLYAKGARIAILPEVLAIRGGEPGISADLERSGRSIRSTLCEEFPDLTDEDAARILAFRRKCADPDAILGWLGRGQSKFTRHLARMVLDTLFQRQSTNLDPMTVERLVDAALAVVSNEAKGTEDIRRLAFVQNRRAGMLDERTTVKRDLEQTIDRFAAEEEARIAKAKDGPLAQVAPPSNLVVSLTSFPARIKTVNFAIRSLLEQTCPPKEIHLWLGRDEIPNRNWLPRRLRDLEERGLQIHFANRTFHQYDKFLHNADLNRDAPFVIVDDDVIYPPTALEHLALAHRRHPDVVIGNRCHRMEIDQRSPAPYRDWQREVNMPEPSHLLMPTGAGGVLYPKGFLSDPMVTRIDDILSLAPYADDIWLKICALARGIPTVATALSHRSDWYHRYTPTMQVGTLMHANVGRGLNDIQLARCLDWLSRIRPAWRAELLNQEAAA